MLEFILRHSLLVTLLEIGAAICGTLYLKKVSNPRPGIRLFVYYLWFMVFVEIVGFYSIYAYFTDYSTLPFLKDSRFERNVWLYNSYNVIKFLMFFIFFIKQLRSNKLRRIFYALTAFFALSAVVNLITSGVFFTADSAYVSVTGAVILLNLILFYYYEILTSEKILFFYKNLTFYISVGLLVWHLTITPLFIYNRYFSTLNPDFVALHMKVIKYTNIFLYGIIIAGFVICSRKEVGKLMPDYSGIKGKSTN